MIDIKKEKSELRCETKEGSEFYRYKKFKKILKIIGIIILIIIIICSLAFTAKFIYEIGVIDGTNNAVTCANKCTNWWGIMRGDCFNTCIWHETHTIGWAKM